MYCTNCGNKLNNNDSFCTKCGFKINKSSSNLQMTKENNNNITLEKVKKFVFKYKKPLIIGFSSFIFLIVILLLYNCLFGFEKLKWNKNYTDYQLSYATQSNLKLGIDFSDLDKVNQIKYKVSCGSEKHNNLEVNWDLTKAKGKCKITAQYKLKRISKKITVISIDDSNNKNLYLDEDLDLNSEEDLDFDKLTNKQEKKYKTNPLNADTDMDGLEDEYEINTSKTSPNKKDSDNDGLNDYDEIELGFDPLKADSKGDGIKDGKIIGKGKIVRID